MTESLDSRLPIHTAEDELSTVSTRDKWFMDVAAATESLTTAAKGGVVDYRNLFPAASLSSHE